MKTLKACCLILIASIITIGSCSLTYANDFTSKHITLKNDEKATIEKGYPVIIATNTTDSDLNVTYDFYYDEKESKMTDKAVNIKAKQSIIIEIPELKLLGKTGESRTVWFDWSEKDVMKPLHNQIKTYPFKNNEKVPVELG